MKNDTLLAYPTTTGRFILDTDASDYGAGAVLYQEQADMDGKLRERPIVYYSKGFNTAERNYCTTKRELLAIVYAVKKFRPYIFGRPFIIRTDHSSLQHLLNFKEAEGILARWITQLQEFDFKINYRCRKEIGNADGLSRKPTRTCKLHVPWCSICFPNSQYLKSKQNGKTKNSAEIIQINTTSKKSSNTILAELNIMDKQEDKLYIHFVEADETQDVSEDCIQSDTDKMITNVLDMGTTWYKGIYKRQMIEAQKNDPILKKIRPLLIAGEAPPKSKMRSEGEHYRTFVRLWKELLIQDGIMYRKVNQPPLKKSRIQYILPNSLKSHVLRACHNAPMTGHMGHTRTLHNNKEILLASVQKGHKIMDNEVHCLPA